MAPVIITLVFGVFVFVQSTTRFQWVKRRNGRMSKLSNSAIIGPDRLNPNQSDVITFVIDKIQRRLLL